MIDTVRSDSDVYGTKIRFLSVFNSKENFSGILGLAPNDESAGPLLVNMFYS